MRGRSHWSRPGRDDVRSQVERSKSCTTKEEVDRLPEFIPRAHPVAQEKQAAVDEECRQTCRRIRPYPHKNRKNDCLFAKNKMAAPTKKGTTRSTRLAPGHVSTIHTHFACCGAAECLGAGLDGTARSIAHQRRFQQLVRRYQPDLSRGTSKCRERNAEPSCFAVAAKPATKSTGASMR